MLKGSCGNRYKLQDTSSKISHEDNYKEVPYAKNYFCYLKQPNMI